MYRSFEKETTEGDASLTEEGVQEVVCHGHLVFRIDIHLADTQYDIFEVRLIHGGCRFLVRGLQTQDRTLIVFYLEYVKLGFYNQPLFLVVFDFCRGGNLTSASLLLLLRFFSLPWDYRQVSAPHAQDLTPHTATGFTFETGWQEKLCMPCLCST